MVLVVNKALSCGRHYRHISYLHKCSWKISKEIQKYSIYQYCPVGGGNWGATAPPLFSSVRGGGGGAKPLTKLVTVYQIYCMLICFMFVLFNAFQH